MTNSTTEDVIKAAASVARDVTEGRLDPAALDHAVADECRVLFGEVVGADDQLWPLHLDVARQVLAADGLSADELSEWLAVARSRAGEPVTAPQPSINPLTADSPTSSAVSHEIDIAESDLSDDDEPEREPDPTPGSESGCGSTSLKVVTTADGRRIPSRLIVARGRDLPDPGYLI